MARIARKVRNKRGRRPKGTVVVQSSGNILVKDLVPKDADLSSYGTEPNFATQPDPEKRTLVLIKTYNWYSHFYSNIEAKEFLVQYLESVKSNKVKLVRKVPESRMIKSVGWMARAAMRGLQLDAREVEVINNTVDKLILTVKPAQKDENEGETVKVSRANVQEVMRERASDAAGEIEEMLDAFLLEGCPKNVDVEKKIIEALSTRKVLPQHISETIKHWQNVLGEFNEVLTTKNAQIKEGYASYSKAQIKSKIAFVEQVIAGLNGYVSLKQATKQVRVRKPVPVEKLVARLKHLKTFKDEKQGLDLTGMNPTKLVGSSEAWVYDTAKRKMYHFVADQYAKVLGVKGNTVLGFDKNLSEVKTLRKPSEQIKQLVGSKPAARKYFENIRAVAVSPKGRFNKDMIILRAF